MSMMSKNVKNVKEQPNQEDTRPSSAIPAELTIVLMGGLLIIGRLMSGTKLLKPRVLRTYEEMERGMDGKQITVPKISLTPFPGVPPFIALRGDIMSYTVPNKVGNKAIYDLYERVTNPSVDPG